jgi:hypothetical protein
MWLFRRTHASAPGGDVDGFPVTTIWTGPLTTVAPLSESPARDLFSVPEFRAPASGRKEQDSADGERN